MARDLIAALRRNFYLTVIIMILLADLALSIADYLGGPG